MGATSADIGKPTVETFNKLRDDFVLPLAVKESNIPEFFKYTDGTREFVAFNSAPYMAEINGIMNIFKEVSAEILTPRGARAIIKAVGKRAGAAVGDAARVNYSWNELDSSIASLTQTTLVMFGLAGWGIPNTTSRKGADGKYMTLYRCKNTFETDKISSKEPVCVILSSFLEGITDSITQAIAGQSSECREVKCAAMGDKYCAIALKLKDKGAPPLDWAALEGEWRALDEAPLA
jgi:predicted hydrocarbon binding protein